MGCRLTSENIIGMFDGQINLKKKCFISYAALGLIVS